ncbi:MAG: hemin uptake protein HemP [Planctomycetota bacterium]
MQHREHDEIGGDTAERRLPNASVIDSAQLLANRKEIQIRHAGEVYRLRVTKNGKLILNK